MTVKKNDFDQEEYVEKVDSAHDKLKAVEGRLKHLENLTDASLLLKTFRKDSDLRGELENLIWKTIQNKAWLGFLWILGAVIIIPIFSKIFFVVMSKFGVHLG